MPRYVLTTRVERVYNIHCGILLPRSYDRLDDQTENSASETVVRSRKDCLVQPAQRVPLREERLDQQRPGLIRLLSH
jgi:hypothetical protein